MKFIRKKKLDEFSLIETQIFVLKAQIDTRAFFVGFYSAIFGFKKQSRATKKNTDVLINLMCLKSVWNVKIMAHKS